MEGAASTAQRRRTRLVPHYSWSCALANTHAAHLAPSARDSRSSRLSVSSSLLSQILKADSAPVSFVSCNLGFALCDRWIQLISSRSNTTDLTVAREVLKHVYATERLQTPMSPGAVLGTYGTLWARARSIGYWREVVRSGEYARLGMYALEAYDIFKVRITVPYLEGGGLIIVLWVFF
jgi:hypothetical protein